MASIEYVAPVDNVRGKIAGLISRTKKMRDANGKVIAEGKKEGYRIENPRNWDIMPAVGAERANQSGFGAAASIVSQELADPERRQYWNDRFLKQLRNADAEAPIDRYTRQPKIYKSLRGFVLAMCKK